MAERYNRSNFLKKEIVNNIPECDLITNVFNDLQFKRQFNFYTVREDDLKRPDIISYKFYKKINFWWIILKVNNIEDPHNDLQIGQVLKIPDFLDIEEFYMKNRRKNR